MVEVKNIEVFNLDRAKRAVKNSFNVGEINTTVGDYNDKRVTLLGSDQHAHQSHDAWLKGILVTFDIKGNDIFMPEFQRYHFEDIVMSQSTMHSLEKFLTDTYDPFTKYVSEDIKTIAKRNYYEWKNNKEILDKWIQENSKQDIKEKQKLELNIYKSFEILVHNLPRGFELWATVNTNYLQLKTIVIQRSNHKNQEDWGNFVEACYSMPEFRKLCGFEDERWNIERLFPMKYMINNENI